MLTEQRADELKAMDKDDLIQLLLETERQRDELDRRMAHEPGRYAFWHRHLALAYVRRHASRSMRGAGGRTGTW